MAERTYAPPDQHTPPLPESYAAQILTVAARVLPYGDSVGDVNPWNLHEALTTAEDAIVGQLPEAVRHDASTRARASLPKLTAISRGEYAQQLRTMAEGMR